MSELKIKLYKFLGDILQLGGLALTLWLAKIDWIGSAAVAGYLTITFAYLEGHFWSFYESEIKRKS